GHRGEPAAGPVVVGRQRAGAGAGPRPRPAPPRAAAGPHAAGAAGLGPGRPGPLDRGPAQGGERGGPLPDARAAGAARGGPRAAPEQGEPEGVVAAPVGAGGAGLGAARPGGPG